MISNEISRIDVHFINCKIQAASYNPEKGQPTYTYDQ